MTTLLNTRGVGVEVRHRGETFHREPLSMTFTNTAPKWREGKPESCIITSLRGVSDYGTNPSNEQAEIISSMKNPQARTQYRLKCGIAHCSKNLGIHPSARLPLSHRSPGHSYKIPNIAREYNDDNGECMYNVIGLAIYGKDMQQRVRKECNDWIEKHLVLKPAGIDHVADEQIPIPVR